MLLIKLLFCICLISLSNSVLAEMDESQFDKEISKIQKLSQNNIIDAVDAADLLLKQITDQSKYEHLARTHMLIFKLLIRQSKQTEALVQAEKAIEFSNKSQNKSLMILSLMNKGEALVQLSQLDDGEHFLNQAIELAKTSGQQNLLADCYILRARMTITRSRYQTALQDLLQAQKIYQQLKSDSGILNALGEIAGAYNLLKEYDKSINYYKQSLQYFDNEKEPLNLSIIYFNIGNVYIHAKKTDLAQKYFEMSRAISKEINDELGMAYADGKLAVVLQEQKEYQKASELYRKRLPYFRSHNRLVSLFNSITGLAEIETIFRNFDLSESYLKEAEQVVNQLDNDQMWHRFHKVNAFLYKRKNDMKNFIYHIEQQIKFEEKIHQAEKNVSLLNLAAEFKINQQEADNILLKTKNDLQYLQIKQAQEKERSLLYLLWLIGLIVSFIIYFLYQQIKSRNALKILAHKDDLTGAPNRRAILEFAKQHFKLSQKTEQPFTIALVDLDLFKQVNDSYGHDTGDEVLKAFSASCQSCLRSHDLFGRFGGEEWLLAFPAADLSLIESIFKRISGKLKENNITGLPDSVSITFSLGAAEINASDKNLNALIKRADKLLYKAKSQGRNTYCTS